MLMPRQVVRRIVVVEYPKCGGSWITSLLGDALGLPKRDINISDGYSAFDVAKHPWYKGDASWNLPESCVIKSHELPDSTLTQQVHDEHTATLHMIRDGRDVIVSRYFFERDFCVRNGILPPLELTFDAYLEKTAGEWRDYVQAWNGRADIECRYEAFLADPAGALTAALDGLGVTATHEAIEEAVARNTKERFAKSLDATFRHNTFVRVGKSGDWQNHFTAGNRETFNRIAGELMQRLGYVEELIPEPTR
jgi:hypothetical protein